MLGEVVEQQPGALAQHGNGSVGAHSAERLDAHARHRRQQHAHFFFRVPKGALAPDDGCRGVHDMLPLREVLEVDSSGIEPVAPRFARREFRLDFVVFDETTGDGVDEEHLAGAQASLANDATGVDVEHADLAGQHDESVIRDQVATGAQSVAVEGRADEGTVGEHDRGRAVPRLHHHRVVLVEGATFGVLVWLVLPGLRHHHHDGVREGPTGQAQQLNDLIEGGRVAPPGGDDRQERCEVAE